MNHLDIDKVTLKSGAHSGPDDGMCVMEAVAYFAGEPFSDRPRCTSPVIGAFLRSWNDGLPTDQDRAMLKPYIPKVVGTNTGPADDEKRAFLAIDWLIRECTPAWLRLAGLMDKAEKLGQLAEILDYTSASSARPAIEGAAEAARAAWAAGAAGAAGAARAAGAAEAARAARAAEASASPAEVRKRIEEAIENELKPVTKGLQVSALSLLDRMVAVGR
ncbi:MAG: hypothetical protein ACRDH9_09255 [Actinomycetota bacterium]